MNIVCLFGILLIATESDGFAEASQRKGDLQQRTLLRKLQSYQRNDATNSESVTWNEILADALVTKMNIFPENKNIAKTGKSVATTFLSEILIMYKSLYDRYSPKKSSDGQEVVNVVETKPKDDVEVLHPDHKETCDNCDDVVVLRVEEDAECAKGFVLDKNGDCVPAPSKLILAIPNQCPVGYRADRLGFCRIFF